MKRRAFALGFLLIALTVTLLAADITGNWSGQMGGPNGEGFAITFAFKQDGAKLTGTVQGPQGEPIQITDGKVEGDKISFTVTVNGQMVIKHDGTISGDEIKLTSKTDNGDFPGGTMTLTRAK
jgi:hypothetical protein